MVDRGGAMVNRAAYKGEKRQKEIARQKKQEEKRLRRHARNIDQTQDAEVSNGEEREASSSIGSSKDA
jgi:hypothetical protein